MADPVRPPSPEDFWRCPKCRTPNPAARYVTTCLGCGATRPVNAPAADPGRRPATAPAGPAAPSPAKVIIKPIRGRVLLALSWAYGGFVLFLLAMIHGIGDRWWAVTPLLFMPRALFLLPPALLAILSLARRSPWHLAIQAATAAVVAGPLMDATIPFHRLWESPPAGERLRIATYNLGLDPIDNDGLIRWIEREKLHVVCLQETSTHGAPLSLRLPEGWRLSAGKMIATRLPIVGEYPEYPIQWHEGRLYPSYLERLKLKSPAGREFVVASVHMPTLREGIEALFRRGDTAAIDRHNAWWGEQLSRVLATISESGDLPLLLAGDFNMPADDSTMASLHSSFQFAFEEAGIGYGYTRPSRHSWVRIDHILAGPEWYVSDCRLGPNLGSDHLPLRAELVLIENAPGAP